MGVTIELYNSFYPLASDKLEYLKNWKTLTRAERAEQSVSIQQKMNETFATYVKDTMLGQHIDILV